MDEITSQVDRTAPQGTLDYAAPECLRGEPCTHASDLYSVGVILYEMLTRRLPYGESDSPHPKRNLSYRSAPCYNPEIPTWVDGALKKAVHPQASKRYAALSELLHDLRHPNPVFQEAAELPLLERDPLRFWQILSGVLLLLNLILLYLLGNP